MLNSNTECSFKHKWAFMNTVKCDFILLHISGKHPKIYSVPLVHMCNCITNDLFNPSTVLMFGYSLG